jgi:hypothetical protein
MKCPFRFKEFTTEESHQRCVDDCALLMQYNDSDQYKLCAFALMARTASGNVWMPVNYRNEVD